MQYTLLGSDAFFLAPSWTNPCYQSRKSEIGRFVAADDLLANDCDEACLDLGLVAAFSLDLGFVVISTWVFVGSSRSVTS
jgi:hypothetical protein